MGDILQHLEVFLNTMEKIGSLGPGEEYTYIELGNYLTDMSQCRDPFAYMMAKRTIWENGKKSNRYVNLASNMPFFGIILDPALRAAIDVWLNELMGEHQPAEKRYGKLASYFEKVVLGITHVIFADDIKKKSTIVAMLPAFKHIKSIPSKEVDRVYDKFFTQYYPHEHLDYPPYYLRCEEQANNSMYQRGSRGLIQFVEVYLKFLSEELSKLELSWKEKLSAPRTSEEQHDILVTFGKLLHAVEDYFFHTNYVEIHLWNAQRRLYSSAESEDIFKARFARDALRPYRNYPGYTGYGSAAATSGPEACSPTQCRRKLMRRLRYPVCTRSALGSTDFKSVSSLDMVYPGGFGSTELFHTMANALESLENVLGGFDALPRYVSGELQKRLGLPNPGRLKDSDLVLIRTLFNADERTRLSNDEDYLDRQLKLHIKQITPKSKYDDSKYEDSINGLRYEGFLNDQAQRALLRAFDIDNKMEAMNSRTPGCGGFLITFSALAQGELNKSRDQSKRLDNENMGRPNEGNVLDERPNNGASGETIGTHTLMAKDTPKSQPLHEDAKVLAKYASLAIVRLMLTEINDNPDTGSGLDWERILRHLVRFPSARQNMWETQALAFFRQGAKNPEYGDLKDRPEYPRISVISPDRRLQALRTGNTRGELEKRYTKLEKEADKL